jgi:hypothetical protein
VRWCRDMRVGRGDGRMDDADVCGLRTVRHTRPEVESMCAPTWVWLLERGMYIRTFRGLDLQAQKRHHRSIHHAGRLIKRAITHAGGAVWLVCYH